MFVRFTNQENKTIWVNSLAVFAIEPNNDGATIIGQGGDNRVHVSASVDDVRLQITQAAVPLLG